MLIMSVSLNFLFLGLIRLKCFLLGGVSQITEKCFQDGHLEFVGSTNWVYKRIAKSPYKESNWKEMTAIRTKSGTWPVGSEWTKIEAKPNRGTAIKDLVQVPANLEPGFYILSFRWDAQSVPQIWSSCANIILELPK